MKILICGKGGSGKSTIVALLAKNLQCEGYRVLVVDADESNYGLSTLLGVKEPKELMDQVGGKKAVKGEMGKTLPTGQKAPVFHESWSIDQIPPECLSKTGSLYLLQIGKVKHYGEGCACPMGVLSKDFLSHLTLAPKDVAIVDTEAGVEHLGRGVVSSVDIVLAVIDPSYESIKLSKKIGDMVRESKKAVYFIINKASKKAAEKILAEVGDERVIGVIPYSEAIQEKGLNGEALGIETADLGSVVSFLLQILRA